VTKPVIAFIGGGNMASSMIGGMIGRDYPADHIVASDPVAENLVRLNEKFGVNVTHDNLAAAKQANTVVMAVKPQMMKEVAMGLKPALDHCPLVISIAAGIPLLALSNWLGDTVPIIRCMPNTPAFVQACASGLFANSLVSVAQRQQAENILCSVGIAQWLDSEEAIDWVTGLSGSGPAYYFLLMEIMEKVGTELGLNRETARRLTQQTALGAARMAQESDVDVGELRRRVTSPGGTTEAAIRTLLGGDFENLFRQAIQDAVDRAAEMAREVMDK